ncbi:helix-turn-helix domain-containing protein [Chitinophaga arvensicola]|uniref:DNA-binding transcriptional regulator, XRE-family HTH domain n=1 Tax=Chitinophaga arvensicola TaxID=29529 RepID=A0A1I0PKA1_9BACT|nr:helix-turn-helix transcriptional regulator [Chitinophaga arvensicola]SEW14772.1 DNA-binding transcriptional regulator, XRE-family HTH domain [Chitinophaga arvensicola]
MRTEVIELGKKIQQRRELLGLLQTQLAALSGVSTRTIQLVEQGKGNPSLQTLVQLTDPLGLHIDLLLKQLDNENSAGFLQ